jgi:hypothetical protein
MTGLVTRPRRPSAFDQRDCEFRPRSRARMTFDTLLPRSRHFGLLCTQPLGLFLLSTRPHRHAKSPCFLIRCPDAALELPCDHPRLCLLACERLHAASHCIQRPPLSTIQNWKCRSARHYVPIDRSHNDRDRRDDPCTPSGDDDNLSIALDHGHREPPHRFTEAPFISPRSNNAAWTGFPTEK